MTMTINIEQKFEEASGFLRGEQPDIQSFVKVMRQIEQELGSILASVGITQQQPGCRIKPETITAITGVWSTCLQLRINGQWSLYFDAELALWDAIQPFLKKAE